MASNSFEGTSAWLRGQWSNPSDIFTILLIIGGDIVQVAIAQLCGGPIKYLTPVSFSFGWTSYAISALRSAVGDNRLMPRPELDCMVINAESGYKRQNYSWVLSRMLRDFDFWRPRSCDEIKGKRLAELKAKNKAKREGLEREIAEAVQNGDEDQQEKIEQSLRKLPTDEQIRIALRVTVWRCNQTRRQGAGDVVYWIGIVVSSIQLGIAAIPWGIYGEWFTFLVTASGTLLAYASGALPQWFDEKSVSRTLKKAKGTLLTEGNGAEDVILILAGQGVMDFEALAAPQREIRGPWTTRITSALLAVLWVSFLITVAGWKQRTWYLLGVGMIGMLHNVGVAGSKRHPREAWGIELQYKSTICDGKVMEVLRLLEEKYPNAGHSLRPEFFPGGLHPREVLLWEFARKRHLAWQKEKCPVQDDGTAVAWAMPSLYQPDGRVDDGDIPDRGVQPTHAVQPVNGDTVINIGGGR